MPRLNRLGHYVCGVGGGAVHVGSDNQGTTERIVLPPGIVAGSWNWLDDTTPCGSAGSGDAPSGYDIWTPNGIIAPGAADIFRTGGGHWAASSGSAGLRSSWGLQLDPSIYGLAAVGDDGEVVCTFTVGNPREMRVFKRDGEVITIDDTGLIRQVAERESVFCRGGIVVWWDLDTARVKAFNLQTRQRVDPVQPHAQGAGPFAMSAIANWSSKFNALVVHPWTSVSGFVLPPLGFDYPDIVRLDDGRLRIVSAEGQGELQFDISVYDLDFITGACVGNGSTEMLPRLNLETGEPWTPEPPEPPDPTPDPALEVRVDVLESKVRVLESQMAMLLHNASQPQRVTGELRAEPLVPFRSEPPIP